MGRVKILSKVWESKKSAVSVSGWKTTDFTNRHLDKSGFSKY
jgi:hypothetical protein